MITYALFDQSENLQIGHWSSENCPIPVIFPSEVLDSIGIIPSVGAGVTGSDLVPLSTICIAPVANGASVDTLLDVNSVLVDLICCVITLPCDVPLALPCTVTLGFLPRVELLDLVVPVELLALPESVPALLLDLLLALESAILAVSLLCLRELMPEVPAVDDPLALLDDSELPSGALTILLIGNLGPSDLKDPYLVFLSLVAALLMLSSIS